MGNFSYATETIYQARLIKKLERRFPGCVVIKNDPAITQGYPDLLVLIADKWVMLEVKLAADSKQQPNQEYYVDKFGTMGYAAFIYPEIEEQVLDDIQSTLRA